MGVTRPIHHGGSAFIGCAGLMCVVYRSAVRCYCSSNSGRKVDELLLHDLTHSNNNAPLCSNIIPPKKIIGHDGRQSAATSTPNRAVSTFRHIPGDGLRPGRRRHPLQLPPDRRCPRLSGCGFEALFSSPLAFRHKNTSSTKVEDEEFRKEGFPRSVLISPHCSCFYQVLRTDILTVHCKHAITSYICPGCIILGFDIAESYFMKTAQQKQNWMFELQQTGWGFQTLSLFILFTGTGANHPVHHCHWS